MGRLEVSGGAGGASQSSFRELDDVFLQTQTRIWLGEVLNMRLDEQIPISDLLADGDLLCEVSKVIWNMLTAKYAELRHLKYKPIGSRKRSGRYMPYSNVDSFLAICKILGLDGIDLFLPSDVVEKGNTRKVCICVRAVSKKVRSKQLNVPNFDMVTCAVAMPKDMVGGIKRSLETSKSSISTSSSYNSSYNYQRSIVRQRNLIEGCDRNYDSCSEGSDEAESKYMGAGEETEESYCSSTNKFNDYISDDIEDDDLEVSSIASVSSILDRALNLEFDDIDQSCVVPAAAVNSFEINDQVILAMEDDDDKCSSSALNGSNDANILQSPEVPNECDTIPKDMEGNLVAQNASNTKDGKWLSPKEPLLLKTVQTVASGTAIAGLLFLLLRLREGKKR
ncbi:PREDICTED: protein OPAQUE10-like isoform X2 [Ipomoea nil]|uniref:protein OPAQUE10-like isoform X2 n=1 Tax=Ipomoea nil TaxID=35883 RepID=UPI00090168CD|nr:PREDICTED: protein OPAQUE10-like isoform X2 [Ipomoea nil]